jgi:hypothetical protein
MLRLPNCCKFCQILDLGNMKLTPYPEIYARGLERANAPDNERFGCPYDYRRYYLLCWFTAFARFETANIDLLTPNEVERLYRSACDHTLPTFTLQGEQ